MAGTTATIRTRNRKASKAIMTESSITIPNGDGDPNEQNDTLTTSATNASPASMPKSPLLIRTLSRASTRGEIHHSLIGIILITMGSFSFSCMFLFVKLVEGKANTFTVSFYRALVEIPIALYLCESDDGSRQINDFLGPPTARKWLSIRGGMGAAAVLCFFYAIQHMPLPDAVTLQFTTPPFAAGFAVLFAGEKWMLLDMIGAVVCLLGVMLIAHPTWLFGEASDGTPDAGVEGNDFVAIVVAIFGAAFAGLAYTSVRMIGHDASANVMVLYYSCMSLPVILIACKGINGYWNVWEGGNNLEFWDWCLIIMTGITAYTGQYLTNLGLQCESAATGTLATCSQIVFTYMFELMFLHEGFSLWSFAGTVLILGFMVLVGIHKMKDADAKTHETVAGEPEELALLFAAERHVHVRKSYDT